jgi:peptidyl-prolyl cis-trans isomerase B (cyclophilin B)
MKTLIFFDVDNTLYDNKLGMIPLQTQKLIKELSSNPNIVLGLATGRSLKKLEIIQDVLHFFKYRVLINGTVIFKDDQMIYDEPILVSDILEVIHYTSQNHLNIGMCALEDEAVNYWDHRVEMGMKHLRGIAPKVDPLFYEKYAIYQLWVFADHEQIFEHITTHLPKFLAYPWHVGGADFLYKHMNKAYGIKKIIEIEKFDQLICVGDGANDVQMIEMADIGIAMGNSRFTDLKEKADHVAPHIMDDQLYDFFKKIHLI